MPARCEGCQFQGVLPSNNGHEHGVVFTGSEWKVRTFNEAAQVAGYANFQAHQADVGGVEEPEWGPRADLIAVEKLRLLDGKFRLMFCPEFNRKHPGAKKIVNDVNVYVVRPGEGKGIASGDPSEAEMANYGFLRKPPEGTVTTEQLADYIMQPFIRFKDSDTVMVVAESAIALEMLLPGSKRKANMRRVIVPVVERGYITYPSNPIRNMEDALDYLYWDRTQIPNNAGNQLNRRIAGGIEQISLFRWAVERRGMAPDINVREGEGLETIEQLTKGFTPGMVAAMLGTVDFLSTRNTYSNGPVANSLILAPGRD